VNAIAESRHIAVEQPLRESLSGLDSHRFQKTL
jgi:hypothetical protein